MAVLDYLMSHCITPFSRAVLSWALRAVAEKKEEDEKNYCPTFVLGFSTREEEKKEPPQQPKEEVKKEPPQQPKEEVKKEAPQQEQKKVEEASPQLQQIKEVVASVAAAAVAQ